jgi:hypothetical protein
MSSILHFLAALAAFSTITTAYNIVHQGGLQCRGAFLSKIDIGIGSGCRQDHGGVAAAVSIKPDEGGKDFGSVVVFFKGDDCKPSDIMNDGWGFSDEGCFTGNYGSYEIWDLWKVEGMGLPV